MVLLQFENKLNKLKESSQRLKKVFESRSSQISTLACIFYFATLKAVEGRIVVLNNSRRHLHNLCLFTRFTSIKFKGF